jgi:hypothetical protein
MSVFIVFEQSGLMTWTVVKVFDNEQKAKNFCDEQNKINKPEFDDWGYTEGIYHTYSKMEVE